MRKIIYTSDRQEWREWLETHFETEIEVWFVFPMKESNEESISYNDAVEEALCFGWIDSTIKHIDPLHRAQRFTPRKPGSPYSQPNIERLRWLDNQNLLHPSIRETVLPIITAPYIFPEDIIASFVKMKGYGHTFPPFPMAISVSVSPTLMPLESVLPNSSGGLHIFLQKPVKTNRSPASGESKNIIYKIGRH
mgnify:CR=1 FL=1